MNMNRTISLSCLFALALTISSNAFASKCVDQILKNNGWDQLSQSQADCLTKNADFISATNELCNKKQTAPSEMFQKYLEMESEYKAKFAAMSSEPVGSSQWNVLVMELRQIETEWKVYGYKNEVEVIKWTLLQPAAKSCAGN